MPTASTSHDAFHVLELILTGLGALIVIFLGIQIRQIFNMNTAIRNVNLKLDEHILHMANELPKRVAVADCSHIRRDCLELNKTIIQQPLTDQIEAMKVKCRDNRKEHVTDLNKVWQAIRHHSHTNIPEHSSDKVILES